jgi:hypothetical protein
LSLTIIDGIISKITRGLWGGLLDLWQVGVKVYYSVDQQTPIREAQTSEEI